MEDTGRVAAVAPVAPAGDRPASPAKPAVQMDEVKGPDRGKCWDVDVNLTYIQKISSITYQLLSQFINVEMMMYVLPPAFCFGIQISRPYAF